MHDLGFGFTAAQVQRPCPKLMWHTYCLAGSQRASGCVLYHLLLFLSFQCWLVNLVSCACYNARATFQSASSLDTSTFPEAWGSHPPQELQFPPWDTLRCQCPLELGRYGLGLASFVQGECQQHPEPGTVGEKQAVLWSRLMTGSTANDQGS